MHCDCFLDAFLLHPCCIPQCLLCCLAVALVSREREGGREKEGRMDVWEEITYRICCHLQVCGQLHKCRPLSTHRRSFEYIAEPMICLPSVADNTFQGVKLAGLF